MQVEGARSPDEAVQLNSRAFLAFVWTEPRLAFFSSIPFSWEAVGRDAWDPASGT